MIRCRRFALVLAAIMALGGCARSAPPDPVEQFAPRLPGSLRDELPQPSFVLAHADDIGLAAEGAATMRADLAHTQAEYDRLAADLRVQTQELERVLSEPTIDEVAARREADDVIRLEGELKQAHLALRVRTRNSLTPAQLTHLAGLRR